MSNWKQNTHELAVDCIYTALLKLMQTKPYKDITVTDITKKAGVSRMAYYRNFNDKDDILLNHLKESVNTLESKISCRKDLTEESLLREYVQNMQNDPIVERIMQAGLFHSLFEIHRDFIMRVYAKVFHWDMSDDNTLLLIYQKMGSLFGYMLYMSEQKQKANTDILVRHLMLLAEDGV